jgi:predicted N-acetyltransferase YhbS
MEIKYLADHPEMIPELADWFFHQWGYLRPGSSVEDFAAGIRTHLNRDELPLSLVALDGPETLGSASLRQHDMSTRMDLSPWLASVYVAAEHRRRGIGAQLVSAIEEKARELGFATLYLWTPDKEEFYARLGWSVVQRTEYRQENAVVMQKQLASSDSAWRPS